MSIRDLATLRIQLDSLPLLPETSATPQEQYDHVFEVCVQTLDAFWEQYEGKDGEGNALEKYLKAYLHLRQLEFGLAEISDPQHQ